MGNDIKQILFVIGTVLFVLFFIPALIVGLVAGYWGAMIGVGISVGALAVLVPSILGLCSLAERIFHD